MTRARVLPGAAECDQEGAAGRLFSRAAPLRRWRARLAGLCAAAVLAGCGGGSSQQEPFAPEQYVAFGDEHSLLLPDGRRYTVNPLDTAGTAIDCASQPLWTQQLASQYQFVFAECNTAAATTFKAVMRAAAGAKVDDFAGQIDAQVAAGGFAAKTLTSVLLGANDIIELYQRFPQTSEADLTAEARARGERLALQVNRLVSIGPRVLIATVPDMGLTPYALAQKAANTDTDRAALLTRLTTALNTRLRVTLLNDGRFVGLVLSDEMVQTAARFPEFYGLSNAISGVCTTALPTCTSQTLVTDGSSATWLWADDRRFAYGGQSRLGALALSRALGNPF